MTSERTRWLSVVLLAVTLVAGACTDPAQSEDTAQGLYDLRTVNGDTPPATVEDSQSGTLTVTGGSLNLQGSGECELRRDLQDSSASTSTDAQGCTWIRTGSALFLTLSNGGAIPTTYDETEGSISLTYHSVDMVFVR